jgi:3-deoxy-D-arabino-heptulosonate 7-phosphate (DAHP) synthase
MLSVYVYVAYRSPHPDQETVNEVNRQLQEKNVDSSLMVDWSVDNCPQEESSAAGGSSS